MYTAAYFLDIAALACFVVVVQASTALSAARRKPFFLAIILTATAILAEAGTLLASHGHLNLRGLHLFLNAVGFAVTPMIPLALAMIVDKTVLAPGRLLFLPTLLNGALAVLSPWLGLVFSVDAANRYARGEYFFVFITVYLTNLLLLVLITLEVGRRNNDPIVGRLAALSIFTFVGTSIQLVYPSTQTTWHCVTLAILLFFLLMSEFDRSFDTLTGLYNRAAFEQAAGQLGEERAFSLIMLDIDDFKVVNDTYGHDYGDQVIKMVAGVLRRAFTKQYTCYRCGGDEFAIISRETNPERIEEQLKSMTALLAKTRREQPLPTVSYGYSVFQGGRLNLAELLKEADERMYRYKRLHKAAAASGELRPNGS